MYIMNKFVSVKGSYNTGSLNFKKKKILKRFDFWHTFFWQSLLTNEDRMKYNKIGMSKKDTPIRNNLILAFIMLINNNIFCWNFLHDVFFFDWEFIFCLRQNSAFSTFFKGESADLLWREISKCTFWKLKIKNRYT